MRPMKCEKKQHLLFSSPYLKFLELELWWLMNGRGGRGDVHHGRDRLARRHAHGVRGEREVAYAARSPAQRLECHR